MKTDILEMYDNLKRDYDSLLKEQGNRDYDEWDYFEDPDSGIGIVVNHFRDGGDPLLNVYVVPKNKVANNNWHSDMEDITYTADTSTSIIRNILNSSKRGAFDE